MGNVSSASQSDTERDRRIQRETDTKTFPCFEAWEEKSAHVSGNLSSYVLLIQFIILSFLIIIIPQELYC